MKEEIAEVSPALMEMSVKLEGMPAAMAISVVAVGATVVCIYAIENYLELAGRLSVPLSRSYKKILKENLL